MDPLLLEYIKSNSSNEHLKNFCSLNHINIDEAYNKIDDNIESITRRIAERKNIINSFIKNQKVNKVNEISLSELMNNNELSKLFYKDYLETFITEYLEENGYVGAIGDMNVYYLNAPILDEVSEKEPEDKSKESHEASETDLCDRVKEDSGVSESNSVEQNNTKPDEGLNQGHETSNSVIGNNQKDGSGESESTTGEQDITKLAEGPNKGHEPSKTKLSDKSKDDPKTPEPANFDFKSTIKKFINDNRELLNNQEILEEFDLSILKKLQEFPKQSFTEFIIASNNTSFLKKYLLGTPKTKFFITIKVGGKPKTDSSYLDDYNNILRIYFPKHIEIYGET